MSENKEIVLKKSVINFYPGHMAKAKRLILDELKNIDIVYEVVDARIPKSSKIKDIDNIIKNKLKILVMTKKDLCDLNVTNKWVKYYENLGYDVLLVNLKKEQDYKKIRQATYKNTKYIQEKRIKQGLKEKEIRALVIGIPNVGKSTLINKMVGKNTLKAENRPGVTKNLTYVKTKWGITILDSPGILWPKLDNEKVALNIASTGGIKKEVLNSEEICSYILNFLRKNYKEILKARYNIDTDDILEMYEIIAQKIGAYKNKEIDYEKVSLKVYNDIVGGNILGVTFDIYED